MLTESSPHGRGDQDPDLQDHLAWLAAGDAAPRTLYERSRLLRRASEHAGTALTDLTAEQLQAWLGTANTPATRSTHYAAVSGFYGWAVTHGRRANNPVHLLRRPRVPRRTPRPLSVQQVRQALAVATPHVHTMILLGWHAGLRCCEIAAMSNDWLIGGQLRVVGKGGHERLIPAHPAILDRARHYPATGPWFLSPRLGGGAVSPQSVSTAISRTMRRAGVSGTAHQLRHSFATAVQRSAHDLRVTQDLLGHRWVTTTQVYVGTAREDLERAVSSVQRLSA